MPEPDGGTAAEPVAVTEGAPAESPAEAALNHAAPSDASATQDELNARIDESLGIIPEPKTETTDDTAPVPGNDDKPAGAGPNDGGTGSSDKPGEGEASSDKGTEEPVAPAKPATETSDKGTEQTPTPSVALTLEVEDAAGKKYQIEKIEDLPEDFNPKNNRQAIQIISDLAKLETKREVAAAQEVSAKATEEARAKQNAWLTSLDSEIATIQAEGRLDKPKAAFGTPEFVNDPAVRRVDEVFKYMASENDRRATAGVEPIRSFTDALDKIELKELRAAEAEKTRQEVQTAKAKSGLIGRTSAGGVTASPVYVAGSARDMSDL